MLKKWSAKLCFSLKFKEEIHENKHTQTHKKRPPNKTEISMGIPSWWSVQYDENGRINYVSDGGKVFYSIDKVKEWRIHGPFEDVDWDDVPSF